MAVYSQIIHRSGYDFPFFFHRLGRVLYTIPAGLSTENTGLSTWRGPRGMRKWIARFAVVHKENLCALALILFFIVFNFLSMQNKTRTADEDKHYSYGMNILNLNSDRLQLPSGIFDDSKMPITALNALPAWLAQRLPASAFKNQLISYILRVL